MYQRIKHDLMNLTSHVQLQWNDDLQKALKIKRLKNGISNQIDFSNRRKRLYFNYLIFDM